MGRRSNYPRSLRRGSSPSASRIGRLAGPTGLLNQKTRRFDEPPRLVSLAGERDT